MAISTISQAGLNAPITLTSPVIAGTPTGVGVLTSGTAVASTSGTSVDFTSIPTWVKRITVMFNGVSTNGTSNLQCQIGTSGGIQTTSYISSATTVGTSTTNSTAFTAGFGLCGNVAATITLQGAFRIQLLDSATGIWTTDGTLARSDAVNYMIAGVKTLSGTLDRVRITTAGGTDTFDAGSVNILYE